MESGLGQNHNHLWTNQSSCFSESKAVVLGNSTVSNIDWCIGRHTRWKVAFRKNFRIGSWIRGLVCGKAWHIRVHTRWKDSNEIWKDCC